MNSLLLGVIIGIVIGKFIFPVVEALKDWVCLLFEQRRNEVVYQINSLNSQSSTQETRVIGFRTNKEGEASNGKNNK